MLREDAECAGLLPFRGLWGLLRMRALGWLRAGSRLLRRSLGGGGFRSQLGEGRLPDDGAPLHAAVLLRRRERVAAPELGEAGAAVEARCFGASDLERVEPDARADPTRVRTAIAERQGDHAVRHSREEQNGELERAARIIETDHILVRKTERFGGLRAHERGIVPGQLGERIGKLLQPPVVREAAVVKRRRREEHDLQTTRRSRAAWPAELRKGLRFASWARLRGARCRQAAHHARRGSTSCRTRPRPGSVSRCPARCRSPDDPCRRPSAPALRRRFVRRTGEGSAAGRR